MASGATRAASVIQTQTAQLRCDYVGLSEAEASVQDASELQDDVAQLVDIWI